MSFLRPLLLLGLFGALVPIVIHLIHRRHPRRLPFAAIEFVLKSVQRVERRWRLRRFLLLASRVIVLAALSSAAAGPLIGAKNLQLVKPSGPERLAVVIDASLSMRARYDGEGSAFSRAVTLARNAIEAMGPEDQAAIILARAHPELLSPRPTSSRRELLEALDRVEPSFEHAELAGAVTAAAETLAQLADSAGADPTAGPAPRPSMRVLVFSDLAGHSLRSAAELEVQGSSVQLELVDVLDGVDLESRTNHAITDLTLESVPGQAPRSVEARARVRTFQPDRAKDRGPTGSEISLRSAEGELQAASMEIIAGTVTDKTLVHAFAEPGFVPVSVRLQADLLIEDDVRYGIADVQREVRTLLVDGAPSGVPKEDEVFYLERALSAGAQDQPPPRVIGSDDLARTDLGAFDVIVLAGVATLGREDGARLIDFVEAGGGLFITATEALDFELYNAQLARILPREIQGLRFFGGDSGRPYLTLGTMAEDHPVLAVFDETARAGLLSARTRAHLVVAPDPQGKSSVLLSFEDGHPALIEGAAGRGRVLLLTTSIDRDMGDLPIRPAFLPLVRRIFLHLGQALARGEARATLVMEPRAIALPPGATKLEVIGPDGKSVTFSREQLLDQVELVDSDTPLPGHYLVKVALAGALEHYPELDFAVNVDPIESDLRPVSVTEGTAVLQGRPAEVPGGGVASVSSLRARGLSDPEAISGALLLLMCGAFLLESLLTARRRDPPRPKVG